jgi:hypothetical protein
MQRDTIESRFWAKVEKTNSCWLWGGSISVDGYGTFGGGNEKTTAHRFAFELENGEIEGKACVVHSCGARHCVNPSHLELVAMGTQQRSSPAERFAKKVEVADSGCWLWTASTNEGGYGHFWRGPDDWMVAHRFSYEHFVGPIPEGLDLDHLCRVRHCVNPEHLEPVTRRENLRRAWAAV